MDLRYWLTAPLLIAFLLVFGLAPTATWAQTPNATIENKGGDVRLQTFYSGGLLAPGTLVTDGTENDSIPAEGPGVRMMWYPEKAAFRVGSTGLSESENEDNWNATNIGSHSVAFGLSTEASALRATAMGLETTASARNATAMGRLTVASGDNSTAMGFDTEASGIGATAMGGRTIASGIDATAMGNQTTAATDQSLSIGECSNANRTADGTLFVAGNGPYSSGTCDNRSDAMVLKKSGDLAVGPSDPIARLHVRDAIKETGATNLGRHAGVVENTSTDDGADVFALKTALDNPRGVTNFISFLDADEQVGTIQGNGNGGIEITGNGADFAEELPVAEQAEAPEPAEIVGVRGGEVSLETDGAGRVMVASRAPIMTGNAEPGSETDAARRVKVAFVGQVPVKTRGSVDTGDLIVASGQNDGTARAVSPDDYRRKEHGPIAGQAWEAKATDEVGEVTVAVGIGSAGPLAQQLEEERERNQDQQSQIADLKAENRKIKKRLAALEEGGSGALPAGVVGPWILAVLLGLGGLAAGVRWRRRP